MKSLNCACVVHDWLCSINVKIWIKFKENLLSPWLFHILEFYVSAKNSWNSHFSVLYWLRISWRDHAKIFLAGSRQKLSIIHYYLLLTFHNSSVFLHRKKRGDRGWFPQCLSRTKHKQQHNDATTKSIILTVRDISQSSCTTSLFLLWYIIYPSSILCPIYL